MLSFKCYNHEKQIWIILQVSKVDVKFRDIIHHYRSQPQSKLHVVRNVFIDQPPLCLTGVCVSSFFLVIAVSVEGAGSWLGSCGVQI